MSIFPPSADRVAAAPPAFDVLGSPRLRALGLAGGSVAVRFDGSVLTLAGDSGGTLALPLARIDRIRMGYEDSRYGNFYFASLRCDGEPTPLVLRVLDHHPVGYGAAMRALAAALAATKGVSAVERGLPLRRALEPLLWMTGVLAIGISAAVSAAREDGWGGAALVLVIPLALFLYFLGRFVTWQMPRPIRALAELDDQLPPPQDAGADRG